MTETHTLAAALAAAQAAFPPIPKDAEVRIPTKSGKAITFRYATLGAILAAVRPALTEQQIAVVHTMDDGKLTTSLLHASGERIDSTITLGQPNQWKDFGGSITYARRYALSAILGVAADDDLDAPDGPAPRQTAEPGTWTLGDDGVLTESGEWKSDAVRDRQAYRELDRAIKAAPDRERLIAVWTGNAPLVDAMPPAGSAALLATFKQRTAALGSTDGDS